MFTSEVQFGHAGSCANSEQETAASKNAALAAAGAKVPTSFDTLEEMIHEVYLGLVKKGSIEPKPELPPPTVPMDYSWARVRIHFTSDLLLSINSVMLKLNFRIRVLQQNNRDV